MSTRTEPATSASLKASSALTAVATLSLKPVNQDATACVENVGLAITGVLMADGIGSHYRAEVASAEAVRMATAHVAGLENVAQLDLASVCLETSHWLDERLLEYKQNATREFDERKALGTTFIWALEFETRIAMGYLGNGALIHIRGNFAAGQPTHSLPWSAVNYLNPHSELIGGDTVLYRFIAPGSSPLQRMPSICSIDKDNLDCGDIVVVCSDGIHSQDQLQTGFDDAGRLWVRANPSLKIFFDRLHNFLLTEPCGQAELTHFLEEYLLALKHADLIEDDCSIGLIVTAKALEYYAKLAAAEGKSSDEDPN